MHQIRNKQKPAKTVQISPKSKKGVTSWGNKVGKFHNFSIFWGPEAPNMDVSTDIWYSVSVPYANLTLICQTSRHCWVKYLKIATRVNLTVALLLVTSCRRCSPPNIGAPLDR